MSVDFITKEYLLKKFPQTIKLSFLSNFVHKKLIKVGAQKPVTDLVLIVENAHEFHKENYKINKKDYPLIAKIFSIRLINFTQKRGARIHYNMCVGENGDPVRYSVIDWKDFNNDMLYWEYLTAAAFLQKPYKMIIEPTENELVNHLQEANIRNTVSPHQFYFKRLPMFC